MNHAEMVNALRALHTPVEIREPCGHLHDDGAFDDAVMGIDYEGDETCVPTSRLACSECCCLAGEEKPHEVCNDTHVWELEQCYPCPTLLAVEAANQQVQP